MNKLWIFFLAGSSFLVVSQAWCALEPLSKEGFKKLYDVVQEAQAAKEEELTSGSTRGCILRTVKDTIYRAYRSKKDLVDAVEDMRRAILWIKSIEALEGRALNREEQRDLNKAFQDAETEKMLAKFTHECCSDYETYKKNFQCVYLSQSIANAIKSERERYIIE